MNPLQLLSIDGLLGGRVGFEVFEPSPEVADERSCSWTRLAAPHKRPLLVYHYSRVRYGEFLDLASLRFGQLLGEPVKFLYVPGFAFRRILGRVYLFNTW
jgi:hypothetical protein